MSIKLIKIILQLAQTITEFEKIKKNKIITLFFFKKIFLCFI